MKAARFPIAAAAGHAATADAAFEVLEAGGSAVDACIAAALAACVVEPVLAGPMGGGFLMLVPDRGAARVLDGFVQTPRRRVEGEMRAVEADFGDVRQVFHIGAGTIAVPGLMPMLFEAHERAGRIPMPELAQAAIRLARSGHEVSAFQARVAGIVAPVLRATPQAAERFGMAGAQGLAAGDRLTTPELADVLEVASIEGPRLFTEGEVARALLSLDGIALTGEDLRRYRPVWRAPLEVAQRGWRVQVPPAPSIGGAQVALMLDALPDRPSPALLHLVQRELLDLRAAADGPIRFDAGLAAHLRDLMARHAGRLTGTTHVSVTDRDGLGAALTLSNGTGAGVIVPGTGIMPNNMLGEEDLLPHGPGSWTPDTRLASAMCPMALHGPDGAVTMLGSGGSGRIRTALSQVALHVMAGLPLEEAVRAPRLHLDTRDGPVMVEAGDARWMEGLAGDWQLWPEPSMYFGGVHAVRRTPRGGVEAAGDPRRDGAART